MNAGIVGALVLAWLLLVWRVWLGPARLSARARRQAAAPTDHIAVIYASQSGTAAEWADKTVHALGARAHARPISDFNPHTLSELRTALFIVSTCDDGDPPDMAHAFVHAARAWTAREHLKRLRFGLLALGDRSYANFCGYGKTLEAWLRQHGATPLFAPVWVDRLAHAALHQWQSALSEHLHAHDWQAQALTRWRLVERRCLNLDSQGAPCFDLRLACTEGHIPAWQAGDIAQVLIGTSGTQRDYSIASIPAEDELRLLVRQYLHPDGTPGAGSRYLGQDLAVGQAVQLHIRSNPGFHLGAEHRRAIFIGAGTGLAGLRALIAERACRDQRDNWLIFGERQHDHDCFWQDELAAWRTDGTLARLDLVFSRDQAEKRYVQHALRDAAAALRDWVARGAVIYLCGSRAMGQAVDQALHDILGEHGLADLAARRGYRRDVY